MSNALEVVTSRVLTRLEDSDSAVWSRSEIQTYVKNGYDRLIRDTNCLWDMTFVAEDQPYCGNHTAAWEEEYMTESAWQIAGTFTFTGGIGNAVSWEQQYSDNGAGPANHTAFFESQLSYTDQDLFAAVVQLPKETIGVDRVTFDNYRIDPHFSRDLADHYKFYEYIAGPQRGYVLDKDGYFSIRKVPVPSAKGNEYTVLKATGGSSITGTTTARGLLRNQTASEFETSPDIINGPKGILKIFPTHFAIGNRGFPRRLYSDVKNFRVEYFRRGKNLDNSPFEIPDRYIKYVELYAMSLARERDGVGQSKQIAAHYMSRYQEGAMRLKRRTQMVLKERISRMGGGTIGNHWPNIAKLPAHYPSMPPR